MIRQNEFKFDNGYSVEVFHCDTRAKEPYGVIVTPPKGIGRTRVYELETEQAVEHILKEIESRIALPLPDSPEARDQLVSIMYGDTEALGHLGDVFSIKQNINIGQLKYLVLVNELTNETLYITRKFISIEGEDLTHHNGELVDWFWKLADLLESKGRVAA
ncbi:MAG: hypothetical protein AB7U37_05835 [Synergistaceae bacterium]